MWLLDKETGKMSCIGRAVRHTASISSVAISQLSPKFFATVAQDSCLKLWDFPGSLLPHGKLWSFEIKYTTCNRQCLQTRICH